MNLKFQSDAESAVPREPLLVDPDAYDASEQEFAASLEEATPRFVVQPQTPSEDGDKAAEAPFKGMAENSSESAASLPYPESETGNESVSAESSAASEPALPTQEPDSWREEVAARLNNYRARRRPREPRYPSLRLQFEPHDTSWSAPGVANQPPAPSPSRGAVALEAAHMAPALADAAAAEAILRVDPAPPVHAEPTARIIPFPRSALAPPRPLEELAEPVPDRPRILDVPEFEPPAPALGGISIEAREEPIKEKRPGFEVPLQAGPLSPRILAAMMDGLLVATASALSTWIFAKTAGAMPPVRLLAITAVSFFGIYWIGYQYLILVYTGSTPGLKLARLRVSRFDGSIAPRRIRRWRVLASVLSALSLGLGYLWCALDEDQLCWHDRITRTYLSPQPRKKVSKDA